MISRTPDGPTIWRFDVVPNVRGRYSDVAKVNIWGLATFAELDDAVSFAAGLGEDAIVIDFADRLQWFVKGGQVTQMHLG